MSSFGRLFSHQFLYIPNSALAGKPGLIAVVKACMKNSCGLRLSRKCVEPPPYQNGHHSVVSWKILKCIIRLLNLLHMIAANEKSSLTASVLRCVEGSLLPIFEDSFDPSLFPHCNHENFCKLESYSLASAQPLTISSAFTCIIITSLFSHTKTLFLLQIR